MRVTPAAAIGVRNLGRKRARISGTIRPAITGELSLQRRLATGKWAQITKHRAISRREDVLVQGLPRAQGHPRVPSGRLCRPAAPT